MSYLVIHNTLRWLSCALYKQLSTTDRRYDLWPPNQAIYIYEIITSTLYKQLIPV